MRTGAPAQRAEQIRGLAKQARVCERAAGRQPCTSWRQACAAVRPPPAPLTLVARAGALQRHGTAVGRPGAEVVRPGGAGAVLHLQRRVLHSAAAGVVAGPGGGHHSGAGLEREGGQRGVRRQRGILGLRTRTGQGEAGRVLSCAQRPGTASCEAVGLHVYPLAPPATSQLGSPAPAPPRPACCWPSAGRSRGSACP